MELPGLQLELQKYRVAGMVLRERESGVSDPSTYKEMNLLSRMVKSQELGDSEVLDEKETKEIEQRLQENRGLSRESAHRIAKVLASVISKPEPHSDGPTDDSEPIPITLEAGKPRVH